MKPDGGILFVLPLILLTFPAGIAGLIIFFFLYDLAGKRLGWEGAVSAPAPISYVVLLWVLMVGAGYWQWFVLAPWIARKQDRLAGPRPKE